MEIQTKQTIRYFFTNQFLGKLVENGQYGHSTLKKKFVRAADLFPIKTIKGKIQMY